MFRLLTYLLVIVFSVCTTAYSQIKLPRLISDGAILQRGIECNVWGWASAKENVVLELNGKNYTTQADSSGNWKIKLPAQSAGGPYEIKITGKNEIILKNILFGDVWVCSGQSNMELTMRRVKDKYSSIVATCENDFIRQFEVPDRYDFKAPHHDLDGGKWVSVNPNTILDFSAVAYFFAKDLYTKYKVPVGIINAALGGSPVEAWLSEEALTKFPEVLQEAKKFKDDQYIADIEAINKEQSSAWYKKLQSQDVGTSKWNQTKIDDSDWKTITLPGNWNSPTEAPTNGSIWFRKIIFVPAAMTGKSGKLWLGRVVDADSVFVNGKFVGATSYQYPPRKYEFDNSLLKAGENTIAVKVISTNGYGGFVLDKPYFLSVDQDTIDLTGEWKYKVAAVMKPMPGSVFVRWKPTGLYNRMIAPLQNYSIKGVIWYQGESNTGNPSIYTELFSTLINSWRKQWQQGDFPFLYVQLANFMESKPEPSESQWAELRQAQLKTLRVNNTAMVVTIDVGEWNDIHPLNKETVGNRLSLAAQYMAYGDSKVVYSGPQYISHRIKGNKVIIRFDPGGEGLMLKGNTELKHVSIAGADQKYFWAKASVKGNKVVVWSDHVAKPLRVRYAWADNPQGANLYNVAGLPASPFQTE